MLIRTIQLYLLKAPANLDDEQLRSFVERARDLYRHYPLEQIAEYAPDIPLALAFYSVLADDFELFCEPQRHLIGFELVDGVPHLRLDRPTVPGCDDCSGSGSTIRFATASALRQPLSRRHRPPTPVWSSCAGRSRIAAPQPCMSH
ncbi:hypothetical protein [Aeromicrobium sp. UC242_57]|uniref:hypothetical protein n=1 Tax=Aeromicrobium sp. UC242_57 TaxID=3374624 RepID=UPI00379D28BD